MEFKTRRHVCRWAFVLLCLLPTFLAVFAVAVTRSPSYVRAVQARFTSRLAASLGLGVRVAQLRRESSHHFWLQDVELFDPESQRWLVRCRSAEAVRTAQGVSVRVGQLEIRSQGVQRLTRILHEHLLQRHATSLPNIQLTANSLVMQQEPRGESFESIRCQVERKIDGTELLLAFHRPGDEDGEPIRLRMVRNCQLDPPATGWELHTGPTPLPCSIAQTWLPGLANLGTDCAFQGSLWGEQGMAGWRGNLVGQFVHVDLDQLITSQFPHKLSGQATLSFERATLDGGYLVDAAGQLQASGGVVSHSLLDAAGRTLGLRLHARGQDTPLIRYQQLAVGFSLDADQLSLQGQIDEQGTVLADAQGSLLSGTENPQLSPLAMLQLLVPHSEVQVPATRETARLLHALPLPEIMPPAARSVRTDYSPLRLR